MIRPWYRSRLFWLGVPGLLFLLWAWGDSNRLGRRVFLQPGWVYSTHGKLLWYCVQSDGSLRVAISLRDATATPVSAPAILPKVRHSAPLRRFFTSTVPVRVSERRWLPPVRWTAERFNPRSSYYLLSVPYWLLTAGYASLWLAVLAGWQRRKARLLNRAVPPPA